MLIRLDQHTLSDNISMGSLLVYSLHSRRSLPVFLLFDNFLSEVVAESGHFYFKSFIEMFQTVFFLFF